MRIIAGKYKGRSLKAPEDPGVRPTSDRVKESIFDLIQFDVPDCRALDLFCGSGALGIECLSRGAESVCFVDGARTSIETVKENLQKIGGNFRLINKDYSAACAMLGAEGEKFDLIFLDPPYAKDLAAGAIQAIRDKELLAPEGKIILERARGEVSYTLPDGYAKLISRDYGAATVEVIAEARQCAVTGSFDPFTKGHLKLVAEAEKDFELIHIVILDNPEKKPLFPVKDRLSFIKRSTASYRGRVVIAHYSGLAIDYCRQHGIRYIIRGVRNAADRAYEEKMAAWNLEHGGVRTILVEAENEISSTEIKELAAAGRDITGLVDDLIIADVTRGAHKWKT